ncbi:MAG: alpha/beta hydrolase [Pseudomonadota bacterium]
MIIDTTYRYTAGLILFFLLGCSSGGSGSDTSLGTVETSNPNAGADVFRVATFGIDTENDMVYAQGLSHSYWNSPNPVTQDLLLDIYTPINNDESRPAMVFIHGGGFTGGDKGTMPPVEFARYFAERGFVSVSINYRLLGDYGTLPQSFNDAIDTSPLLVNADREQIKAMYPATRDAKAALRWVAANADDLGVDPNRISVIGGSAGSYIAIALGATDFDDYKNELSPAEDPTLASTHLDDDVIVGSVVNHWGGPATVTLLEIVDGRSRWGQNDAPLSIVHGTADVTVPYEQAEELVTLYEVTGAYHELTTLNGAGHAAWNSTVDGQSLLELSFDFVARMLDLSVAED